MAAAVNSGPLSVMHSSGMPKVVAAEAVDKVLGSHLCLFDDGPVREEVHNDKIVCFFVVKEVSTYALEGVCWGGWEGAMQLQWLHVSHKALMVVVNAWPED